MFFEEAWPVSFSAVDAKAVLGLWRSCVERDVPLLPDIVLADLPFMLLRTLNDSPPRPLLHG